MNDGGPAFPHGPGGDSRIFADGLVTHQWPAGFGMSLRDYFAGQAMAGMSREIARTTITHELNDAWVRAYASDCYAIADAMLKAREERKP